MKVVCSRRHSSIRTAIVDGPSHSRRGVRKCCLFIFISSISIDILINAYMATKKENSRERQSDVQAVCVTIASEIFHDVPPILIGIVRNGAA